MPARIVVVHDNPDFVERITAALIDARHEVTMFADTLSAIRALEAAQRIELLITGMQFGPDQANGVSLARMARVKRPGVHVLFVAQPELREYAEGVGEFLPAITPAANIVAAVNRILASPSTTT